MRNPAESGVSFFLTPISGNPKIVDMDLTTPALLFPAISLLMLAYTNRFVVLTNVIRQLSDRDLDDTRIIERQIDNLRLRLSIIKAMQTCGVAAFLLCAIAMLLVFIGQLAAGEWFFGASLLLLAGSLVLSLWEVNISTKAINIELEKIDQRRSRK